MRIIHIGSSHSCEVKEYSQGNTFLHTLKPHSMIYSRIIDIRNFTYFSLSSFSSSFFSDIWCISDGLCRPTRMHLSITLGTLLFLSRVCFCVHRVNLLLLCQFYRLNFPRMTKGKSPSHFQSVRFEREIGKCQQILFPPGFRRNILGGNRLLSIWKKEISIISLNPMYYSSSSAPAKKHCSGYKICLKPKKRLYVLTMTKSSVLIFACTMWAS